MTQFEDKRKNADGTHDYSGLDPVELRAILKLLITNKNNGESTDKDKNIARKEIMHIIDLLSPEQLFQTNVKNESPVSNYNGSVMETVVLYGDEETFVQIANKPGVTLRHILNGRSAEDWQQSKIYKHAADIDRTEMINLLREKVINPEGKINEAQGIAIIGGVQISTPTEKSSNEIKR